MKRVFLVAAFALSSAACSITAQSGFGAASPNAAYAEPVFFAPPPPRAPVNSPSTPATTPATRPETTPAANTPARPVATPTPTPSPTRPVLTAKPSAPANTATVHPSARAQQTTPAPTEPAKKPPIGYMAVKDPKVPPHEGPAGNAAAESAKKKLQKPKPAPATR